MALEGLRHILDGYKVLDFSQYVAGPTVSLMMAEMGAEIIKIELSPNGDPSRTFRYQKNGRSAYFVQHNRGKQSVCVDLRTPEGKALVTELVKKVDVLVQNFAPGVIGRMGFGYDAVKALNPKIVMCSISSFGQEGPLALEPGYDWSGAAYAGTLHLLGMPDGPPTVPGDAIGDVSTGVHGACATGYALLHRERTGRGQHLDIALLDSYFHYHEATVQLYSMSGGEFKPKRSGSYGSYVSPAGIFTAKEGYIIIMAYMDHHFASLCRTIGHPELTQDPRFVTLEGRIVNRDALTKFIEEWLAGTASDAAAMAALKENYVPYAPVLTLEEAIHHPHLRQRGTVRTVSDRVVGDFDVPGFALRFSEFPGMLPLQAPLLGEHNEAVLTRYLGYTPEQVNELERKGVLKRADT